MYKQRVSFMKSCIFLYHNLLIYRHKGEIRQEKGGDWRISATSDCLNKKQYILELLIFYYDITSIPQSLKHNFFNYYPALMMPSPPHASLAVFCLLQWSTHVPRLPQVPQAPQVPPRTRCFAAT